MTGAVALFGVSLILAKPVVTRWGALRQEQDRLRADVAEYQELVGKREQWGKRMEELSRMMPQFPTDKKMDIHWLAFMDQTAAKNGLKINKRQHGEEKKIGDVYELPIMVQDWEGTLGALLHFLFDLQSEGAMLDIRQLMIKPKGGGVLRGSFVLYCAYTRERNPGAGEHGQRKQP